VDSLIFSNMLHHPAQTVISILRIAIETWLFSDVFRFQQSRIASHIRRYAIVFCVGNLNG